MSKYTIRPRSYQVAKQLGVKIAPSKREFKKIDVYFPVKGKPKTFRYKFSVGDNRYLDYHMWKTFEQRKKVPPGTAEKRRRAYIVRHNKDLSVKNSKGFFAYRLLWY